MLTIAMVVQMLLCGPMSFTLTDGPLVLDARLISEGYPMCTRDDEVVECSQVYDDRADFAHDGDEDAMP